MAENPTNRRAVKFWTSDFGTAVATADGWLSMLARLAAAAERVLSLVWPAGRAGGERLAVSPSMPPLVSVGLPGRRHRLTPRITSLIHRRLPTTTTTTATKEGGREGEKMLMCIFGA